MDAIRKKMQSLKGETDSLYATIQQFEDATKESNRVSDQVGFFIHSLIHIFDRLIVTFGTTARRFIAWK